MWKKNEKMNHFQPAINNKQPPYNVSEKDFSCSWQLRRKNSSHDQEKSRILKETKQKSRGVSVAHHNIGFFLHSADFTSSIVKAHRKQPAFSIDWLSCFHDEKSITFSSYFLSISFYPSLSCVKHSTESCGNVYILHCCNRQARILTVWTLLGLDNFSFDYFLELFTHCVFN